MKPILFAVSLIILVAYVNCYDLESEWGSYKSNFGKQYDPAEEEYRKQVFKDNLEKIEAHNKKYESGEVSFKMAVNKFADLTVEEYREIYLNRIG